MECVTVFGGKGFRSVRQVGRMVRVGLSIYLMLMTLAGPLVCPCRVAQFLSSPKAAESKETAVQTSSCSCCLEFPTKGQMPTRGLARGGHHTPLPAKCPCQLHGDRPIALRSARVQQAHRRCDDLQDKMAWDALLSWLDCTSLTADSRPPDTSADQPFLHKRHLLHVFYILRC